MTTETGGMPTRYPLYSPNAPEWWCLLTRKVRSSQGSREHTHTWEVEEPHLNAGLSSSETHIHPTLALGRMG